MKYKILMAIGVMLAMLAIPASAISTRSYCTSDEMLVEKLDICNGNGNCYNYTMPKTCDYGCDNVTKSCSPPPAATNMMVIGIITFLAIGSIAITKLI